LKKVRSHATKRLVAKSNNKIITTWNIMKEEMGKSTLRE
jgi:hypothetical protein